MESMLHTTAQCGGQPLPAPAQAHGPLLREGQRVVIAGLRARPDLNGKNATLLEYIEEEERWKVWVEDGFGKKLRVDNLVVPGHNGSCVEGTDMKTSFLDQGQQELKQQYDGDFVPGKNARITGLETRPELNGRLCTLLSFDARDGRWRVLLEDGSGKALYPKNLEISDVSCKEVQHPINPGVAAEQQVLQAGAWARCVGLVQDAALNGLHCRLLSFEVDKSRWRAMLPDGSVRSLLPANLQPIEASEEMHPTHDEGGGRHAAAELPCGHPGDATLASATEACVRADAREQMEGMRVRIQDLSCEPALNGLEATLMKYRSAEASWLVRFKDGSCRNLRGRNLVPIGGSHGVQQALNESGPTLHREDCPTVPQAGASQQKNCKDHAVDRTLQSGMRVQVVGLTARPDLNDQRGELLDFDEPQGRWRVWMDDGSGKLLRPQNLVLSDESNVGPHAGLTGSGEATCGACAVVPAMPTAPTDVAVAEDNGLSVGAVVRVVNLVARPDLNGKQGTIVDFDADMGRWRMVLDDGTRVALRSANLEAKAAATDAPLPAHNEQTAASASAELSPGARVCMRGLQARPDLNGREGQLSEFDAVEARWRVVMDDGSGISVRAHNLELIDGQASQSESCGGTGGVTRVHNGSGDCLDVAASQPLEQRSQQAVAAASFELGVQAQVNGLQNGTELNDTEGELVQFSKQGECPDATVSTECPDATVSTSVKHEFKQDGEPTSLHTGARVTLNATLQEFNLSEGRWRVLLDDGSSILMPPGYLGPPAASHVSPAEIHGGIGGESDGHDCPDEDAGHETLKAGVWIRIAGLVARPELNGKQGFVLERDTLEDRWKVVLSDNSGIRLRPANMQIVQDLRQGARVCVFGLETAPDLNGGEGELLAFDAEQRRWRVKLDNQDNGVEGVLLRPGALRLLSVPTNGLSSSEIQRQVAEKLEAVDLEHIAAKEELRPGGRARIDGLQARRDLNGQECRLIEFDNLEGRWQIELRDGAKRLVWPSNLIAVTDDAHSIAEPIAAGGRPVLLTTGKTTPSRHMNSAEEAQVHRAVDSSQPLEHAGLPGSGAELQTTGAGVSDSTVDSFSSMLQPGMRVQLHGLLARPDLNGKEGHLLDFDTAEGRWRAVLDDGSGLFLRPAHVRSVEGATTEREHCLTAPAAELQSSTPQQEQEDEFLQPGMRVQVHGLLDRPDLNDKLGELVEYDSAEGRWHICMDTGSGLFLQPANVKQIAKAGCKGSNPHQDIAAIPVPSALPLARGSDAGHAESRAPVDNHLESGMRVLVHGVCTRPELNGKKGQLLEYSAAESRWKIIMDDGLGLFLRPTNLRPVSDASSTQRLPADNAICGAAGPIEDAQVARDDALDTPDGLLMGARVEIHGVRSRPDLNGQRGQLCEFDDSEGRWRVVLDNGNRLFLKPINIQRAPPSPGPSYVAPNIAAAEPPRESTNAVDDVQPELLRPGARVRAHSLRMRPELNGKEGELLEFDTAELRWRVLMEDGSGLLLRASNLAALEDDVGRSDSVNAAHQTLPAINSAGDAGAGLSAPLLTATSPLATETRAASAAPIVTASTADATAGKPWHAGTRVQIYGLHARPELNGQEGELLQFDTAEGRWRVVMDNGSGLLLRPGNLKEVVRATDVSGTVADDAAAVAEAATGVAAAEATAAAEALTSHEGGDADAGLVPELQPGTELQPGMKVFVEGLRNRPELNGKEGQLLELDSAEGRWRVLMEDGLGLFLRPSNLRAQQAEHAAQAGHVSSQLNAGGGQSVQPVAHTMRADMAQELQTGMHIQVQGVQARPELNGQRGELLEFDSAEGRWRVVMNDGSGLFLRPTNVRRADNLCDQPKRPAEAPTEAMQQQEQQQQQQRQQKPKEPSGVDTLHQGEELATGSRVRIQGLRARADLNGKEGQLLDFDAAEGRWRVVMDDGSGLLLKPSSLEHLGSACVAAAAQASTSGLANDVPIGPKTAPLDGSTALARNAGIDGSMAGADGQSGTCLRQGARARIVDLQGFTDLNGKEGQVFDYDKEQERWQVVLDDGSRRLVKPVNLLALPQQACCDSAMDGVASSVTVHAPEQMPCSLSGPPSINSDSSCAPKTNSCGLGPNSRVLIHGLMSRPDLNDTEGTLLTFDDAQGRWRLVTDDGRGLLLKACNLKVAAVQEVSVSLEVPAPGDAAKEELSSHDSHPKATAEPAAPVATAAATKPAMPTTAATEPQLAQADSDAGDQSVQPVAQTMRGDMAEELQAGMHIQVHGVQARPELNGQRGELLEFDSAEGRWRVVMNDGSGLFLRPTNVRRAGNLCDQPKSQRPAEAPTEAVQQQQQQQQRQQQPKEASGVDTLHQGKELATGSRVRIQGLNARADLNGKEGQLLDFDAAEGRWRVVMEDGSGLLLKPSSLENLGSPCDAVAAQASTSGLANEVPILPKTAPFDGSSTLARNAGIDGSMAEADGQSGTCLRQGARARIVGLQGSTDLNGKEGQVFDYDREQERWQVVLDDGSRRLVKPVNLLALPQQACCDSAMDGAAPSVTVHAPEQMPCGLSGPRSADSDSSCAPKTNSCGLEPNSRVLIHGLMSRPDLNDTEGTLLSFDDAQGRWRLVTDDGRGLLLKACNLKVAAVQEVSLSLEVPVPGEAAKEELSSHDSHPEAAAEAAAPVAAATAAATKPATPTAAATEPQLAQADSDAGGPCNIAATAVAAATLKSGVRVQVVGLQARTELNGCEGLVLEFDEDNERWKILLDNGSRVLLRPANLQSLVLPPATDSVASKEAPALAEPIVAAPACTGDEAIPSRQWSPGAIVQVHNLVTRADLNGSTGRIVEFDASEGRWRVLMDDGSGLLLRPSNIRQSVCAKPAVDVSSTLAFEVTEDTDCVQADMGPLHPGDRVRICRLRARHDLNGKEGVLFEYDPTEGRWKVVMDDGSRLVLKPCNLERTRTPGPGRVRDSELEAVAPPMKVDVPRPVQPLQAGGRIRAKGLVSRPDVNGKEGHLLQLMTDEERWRVQMDTGECFSLRPQNLEVVI